MKPMNIKINFILTAFSPVMFGARGTCHIQLMTVEEARRLVDADTKIMASRVTHERLARNQFPGVSPDVVRFAELKPGVNALHLHYRGPMIGDDGLLPPGGFVQCYLIEAEEYVEAE